MALTYDTFIVELALLSQFNVTDPAFVSNLPSCIDYATDRITRELNLLDTVTSNTSLQCSTVSRYIRLNTINPPFNVITDVNLLTPVGAGDPDGSIRVPLTIQSLAFLNQVYGTGVSRGGVTGPPQYFAMFNDYIIQVAPYPDATYNVEIIGTVRPIPISLSNESNWISTYLPDLFLAAAMIQMSGFKMNFGSQSDDPKMAQSWETQYVTLRDSAAVEDSMRKYYSTGWTSQLPNQFNPART